MPNARKRPFPETSETCMMLLEEIKSLIDSVDPFSQQKANDLLEMLKKNKCKKALLWVEQYCRRLPTPFWHQFAKKTLEYAKSL